MTFPLATVTLPAGWRWAPFGRVVQRSRDADRPDLDSLSVFLDAGVVPRASRADNFNRLGGDLSKYLWVRPGDLVFNKLRTWQGGLGLSEYEGVVSPAYYVCRPDERIVLGKYLHYLLRSDVFLSELTRISKSMPPSQFDILYDDLARMPVLVAPLDEQRRIADFLDAVTARIDALIGARTRHIALVQERLAAMTSALVWGRRESVRVGIEAVGGITSLPRGWEVLRNKVFLREVDHRSLDGDEELLSVSHLTGVTPRREKTVYMFMAETNAGYKLVREDDLVINTMWAWMGAAGVAAEPGIVSPAYGVYRFHRNAVLPEYYDNLIRTPEYITEMTRYSTGVWSSRLRLYPEAFLRLSAPVPPIAEQREIVDRLRKLRSSTGSLVEVTERQVGLLAEYRQALVTAAVTGRLDDATLKGSRPVDDEIRVEVSG